MVESEFCRPVKAQLSRLLAAKGPHRSLVIVCERTMITINWAVGSGMSAKPPWRPLA
jgi:hypothetical protein